MNEWIKEGWIPGPLETEELFLKRIVISKENSPLLKNLSDACGMHPSWMKILYSNKGLSPWHGGVTITEEKGVTVQLREQFKKRGRFLFYQEEEILAHEAIHAMRSMFSESRFEEVLAYQTSPSSFRKYWGPLFRTPLESLLFMACLFLGSLSMAFSLWLLPLMMIPVSASIGRLIMTQYHFRRCQKKLKEITNSSQKAFAIMLHLTDREIDAISSSSCEEIKAILRFPPAEFRWKQISHIFFS